MSARLSPEMELKVRKLPVERWDGGGVVSEVLKPVARVGICEWAEAAIVLGPRVSAEPGRFRLARVPYLRGMLEAVANPKVRNITVKASAQVAKSTFEHVAIGWLAKHRPGPMLLLLPTKDTAKKHLRRKVLPIFQDSDELRELLPSGRGITDLKMQLTSMDIDIGWPRSPMSLASDAKRYFIGDENDKNPDRSGKEADPQLLAEERLTTYTGQSLCILASTPSDGQGPISKSYRRSNQQTLRVKCPRCGGYDRLRWQQIRWPKETAEGRPILPTEIRAQRLAWYECRLCGGRIEESERWPMVETGVWCPEGFEVVDGKIAGEPPEMDHYGFHVWSAYSPWRNFSMIACQWLLHKETQSEHQNTVNSWLGEDYHDVVQTHSAEKLEALKQDYYRTEIPVDDVVLTVGVDKQKAHLYFVVRAWDAEGTSWLVDWGKIERYQDEGMKQPVMEFEFFDKAVRARQWLTKGGQRVDLVGGCFDSRYDGDLVFAYVRSRSPLFTATQGAEVSLSTPLMKVAYDPKRGRGRNVKYELDYYRVNTTHFKDEIARKIADGGNWYVPRDVDDGYERQLFAEHKARKRGKRGEWWMLKEGMSDNHYFDCEVLAAAAAFKAGVGALNGKLPRAPGSGVSGQQWKARLEAARRGGKRR